MGICFWNIWWIYLYGTVVVASAVIEEEDTFKGIMSSIMVGFAWPIFVPSRIIRKLIKLN